MIQNFDGLEDEDVTKIRNIFFVRCMDRSSDIKLFEEFLNAFEVESWPRKQLRYITNRITANSWEISVPMLMEGLLAIHYVHKIGRENVLPSPELPTGKVADLRLIVGDSSVYLELAYLGITQFEKNLEQVFEDLAESIVENLKARRFIHLFIDVTKLPLDIRNHLDPGENLELLKDWIERLDLMTLFESSIPTFIVNLQRIATLPEPTRTVYDHKNWKLIPGYELNMLATHDPELSRLISDRTVEKWSKKVTPKMLENCPIDHFIVSDSENPVVTLQSVMRHPSKASKAEMSAFLEHLRRIVDRKLEHGQFSRGSRNILVIQAYNWLSHGYRGPEMPAPLAFEEIQKTIYASLEAVKNRDLSCVRVYESDYTQSRTVINPHAAEASKLSNEELKTI